MLGIVQRFLLVQLFCLHVAVIQLAECMVTEQWAQAQRCPGILNKMPGSLVKLLYTRRSATHTPHQAVSLTLPCQHGNVQWSWIYD